MREGGGGERERAVVEASATRGLILFLLESFQNKQMAYDEVCAVRGGGDRLSLVFAGQLCCRV